MSGPRFVAGFETPEDFLTVHEEEVTAGGLLVRGATLAPGAPLGDCLVAVRVGAGPEVEVPAKLAGAAPGLGVMVIFLTPPQPLNALAEKLRNPPAPSTAGGLERETLSMQEKMALATTGDREVRMKLMRDPNKALHVMVLRNTRISLEEVQFAARQASLNPEALKAICEHPEWSQNPGIVTALVKNPKTPLPLAVRLVPRLPMTELKALAKSQGKPPLVQAAKKTLLNER